MVLENLRQIVWKCNLELPRNDLVKILGEGEISQPLTVSAHKFSLSAIQKIEAAGGKAEVIKG